MGPNEDPFDKFRGFMIAYAQGLSLAPAGRQLH
jgi:hypothetical protein